MATRFWVLNFISAAFLLSSTFSLADEQESPPPQPGGICQNPFELSRRLPGTSFSMTFCDINVVVEPPTEESSDDNEEQEETLKSFQIGMTEVTQLQYKTVIGTEPWLKSGEVKKNVQVGDDNPAVFVSYTDAEEFARVLTLIDKTATYRLPTAEEWEYAARGGTKTEYFWGDEFDSLYVFGQVTTGMRGRHAHPVVACPIAILEAAIPGYCANAFGLMHTLGNVSEWTSEDEHHLNYRLRKRINKDAKPPVEYNKNGKRIARGGSWNSSLYQLQLDAFKLHDQADQNSEIGFRIVRVPNE